MAYFGLEPLSASYLTDYLSGDNTTVAYTLSRAPVSASSVVVTISGVKQAASTYGVNGTTLTFSAAPPSGTNNIEVLHLGVQPDTVVLPSYRTITEFTATAGQTSFSPASYTPGYIDVFRNGVKLGTANFTATNGTTVVLNNACSAGDLVRFEAFLITSFNDAIPNTAGAVSDSLVASLSASKLTGSRTLPNTVVPAGSVIQVVSNFSASQITTTSTSFVTTGFSASITPSSSSSKILALVSGMMYSNTSTAEPQIALYRGGSSLGIFTDLFSSNGAIIGGASFMYLDSPSTTSSTTYTLFFRQGNTGSGGTIFLGPNSTTFGIILMEVAA
jgi:hypothetical protein